MSGQLPLLVLILFILVIAGLVGVLIYLLIQSNSLRNRISQMQAQAEQRAREQHQAMQAQADQWAREQYQAWCNNTIASIQVQQYEVARQHTIIEFEQWKSGHEEFTRSDAIQRSQNVIIGNVTQHLVPYFSTFQYNPNDVRFIGTPVDLIIFDGLSEGNLRRIVFAEVKTGPQAQLNGRQKSVRDIVQSKEVTWDLIRIAREVKSG